MNRAIPQLYFEDCQPGMTFSFGDYLMTEEEIIEFAAKYDPQPYHIRRDPGPGKASNELIASGWHTCAAVMRMLVDNFVPETTTLPAGGVDKLRFHRPVRPGDRLRVKVTIGETRPSKTKPDRGIVNSQVEAFNQRDEMVMSAVHIVLYRRRPA